MEFIYLFILIWIEVGLISLLNLKSGDGWGDLSSKEWGVFGSVLLRITLVIVWPIVLYVDKFTP